jgi:hypothetical protein
VPNISGVSDLRLFTYRIDAANVVCFVNPEWLEFALENEALQLVTPGVLGRPLSEFITGMETRYLYDMLVGKVRSSSRETCLPYRCDAPQMRRYMELAIRPSTGQGVEFCSHIVREEEREPVALLALTTARSDQLVTMCGWCKRISTPAWVEVEEAMKILRPFDEDRMPQITHGICEDCYRQVHRAAA